VKWGNEEHIKTLAQTVKLEFSKGRGFCMAPRGSGREWAYWFYPLEFCRKIKDEYFGRELLPVYEEVDVVNQEGMPLTTRVRLKAKII